MSHLVLARKYRPKNFHAVVGQEAIVATLSSAISKNRVAHAMLFTGGRGIGKTTIARLVAKALVCHDRNEAEPCNACANCLAIDNFSSLDVIEIDGASHTGVDDVRDLRDSARYQPSSAKYKIFIIDEVHMLSISAFNALLKILEEPPAHVIFIFATTEAHKIPKTIISRCQRYDFKRVSDETIFLTLKKITNLEGFSIEDEGLRLISSLSEGSLRDSLSLVEQILNCPQDHYSAEAIAATLGVVSHHAVNDICKAVLEGNVDDALAIIKEVYEKGFDLCQLMDAMADRFRVLALCAHVDEKIIHTIAPALSESDRTSAHAFDKGDLKRLFAMAIDAMTQVFQAQKPLFALELFVLRAALRPPMADAVTINYCLQKLDAIMHHRPLPEEPKSTTTKILAPPKNIGDIITNFGAVIRDLAKTSPLLASHLRHARPVLEHKTLTLFFEQSLHYEQVKAHSNNQRLHEIVRQVCGENLALRCEFTASNSDVQPAAKTVAEIDEEIEEREEKALHDRARNHPLVKKALEIFGGDITEVKKIDANVGSE